MNEHPSEKLLEQLLAGEQSDSVAESIAVHVNACLKCREMFFELAEQSGADGQQTLRRHTPTGVEPAKPIDGPERIGKYRLLEQLGQGGMGTVYLARREEDYDETVAIKLIRPGMGSKQVLARFESERQALAMMDHPSIARILDGGITESGQPFFVMELVKGLPITEFCDREGLTTAQRVRLFREVCGAIQHAHQKGVIHRDLKPSNVLVGVKDGTPVAKVIDFGLAKAIGRALSAQTLHTSAGQILGTLEYMSPEQVQRDALDIDTRSDIYSLGVLLYQLLTGSTPIGPDRIKSETLETIVRIIREEEPQRPSERLSSIGTESQSSSRISVPEVRGDLDWVTCKALSKERDRRYVSAAALADDLQRFLQGDPVEASPPSMTYRLSKLVRKHRGKFIAATAFLTLLMAGTAGIVHSLVRARRAEAKLLTSIDRVGDIREVIEQQGLTDDPAERLKQLKRVRQHFEVLHRDYPEDEGFLFQLARSHYSIAHELTNQHQPQAARDHYLTAIRQFERCSPTEEVRAHHAMATHNLSLVENSVGNGAESEALLKSSIAMTKQLAKDFDENLVYRRRVATGLAEQGNRALTAADSDAAIALLLEAKQELDQCGDSAETRDVRASCLARLADAYDVHGDLAEAENYFRLADRQLAAILDSSPSRHDAARRRASLLNNWGVAKNRGGDRRGAIAKRVEASRIMRDLMAAAANAGQNRRLLGLFQNNLAADYALLGDWDRAEESISESLAIRESLFEHAPNNLSYQAEFVNSLTAAAGIAASKDDLELASKRIDQSLELLREVAAKLPQHRLYAAWLERARAAKKALDGQGDE